MDQRTQLWTVLLRLGTDANARTTVGDKSMCSYGLLTAATQTLSACCWLRGAKASTLQLSTTPGRVQGRALPRPPLVRPLRWTSSTSLATALGRCAEPCYVGYSLWAGAVVVVCVRLAPEEQPVTTVSASLHFRIPPLHQWTAGARALDITDPLLHASRLLIVCAALSTSAQLARRFATHRGGGEKSGPRCRGRGGAGGGNVWGRRRIQSQRRCVGGGATTARWARRTLSLVRQ